MASKPSLSQRSTYEPVMEADPRLSKIVPKVRFSKLSGLLDAEVSLHSEETIGSETGLPPLVLNQHFVNTVAYTRDIEGNTSFFSSLFKGDIKASQVGVVQEAKSFAVVETENGPDIEIGVAVRLQVEASRFSSNVQVSIPNIAAEAQLGLSRAEMEISVRGFSMPLGDLLPAPKAVDLTSYTEYVEAFGKVQAFVFSQANRQYLSPVLLGVHTPNLAAGA